MARARTIKPGFFQNEEMAEQPAMARLLFIGLLGIADRKGRLEDRPKRIKAQVFPYEDCDVEGLLGSLSSGGFVLRYEAEGLKLIQIVNFTKHQACHPKEPASVLPGPPEPGKAAASNGKPRQAVESRDDSRPASNASFAPREEQLKPEDPEDPEVPEDPAIEGPEDPGGPDWFDELEFPVTLNTIEARNAVLEFVRYRETKGKPMPELSVQKALRRFARDRWPSRKLIEAIEHSIAQGYDGIVEPKGEGIGPSATRQTNQERVAEHNRTILEKYRSGARGNEPLTVDGEVMEAKEKLQ